MALAPLLLISYLVGAIPTGFIVGKLLRNIDIRHHGSGNLGGTNVWRVLGPKAGAFVLGCDIGKGYLVVAIIAQIRFTPLLLDYAVVAILCGLAAIIGHVFPIYLQLRGGKGVATTGGVMIALAPLPTAISIGLFAVILTSTGYVALGSIIAACLLPISLVIFNRFTGLQFHPLLIGFTTALALFILFNHRRNIARLLAGKENRFERAMIWRRLFR
jgi:glycerol-3-phosphate acyltransferase PlsY